MSRSGYSDDLDQWPLICYRGQVASAVRGRRGQAFLRELLAALDAMPDKRLIAHELVENGQVCALGAIGVARGLDLSKTAPENHGWLSQTFDIAEQLVQEIEFENDEAAMYNETPEHRWMRMRNWVAGQIRGEG
jgi:hypothetical protein